MENTYQEWLSHFTGENAEPDIRCRICGSEDCHSECLDEMFPIEEVPCQQAGLLNGERGGGKVVPPQSPEFFGHSPRPDRAQLARL